MYSQAMAITKQMGFFFNFPKELSPDVFSGRLAPESSVL